MYEYVVHEQSSQRLPSHIAVVHGSCKFLGNSLSAFELLCPGFEGRYCLTDQKGLFEPGFTFARFALCSERSSDVAYPSL